jgi:hypothetical protein
MRAFRPSVSESGDCVKILFRTNPGTWKLGMFWERPYAEITLNGTKPSEIVEFRLVQSPESPE